MQMIHFKEEYGNAQLAHSHSDGFAVLVFFFTVSLSMNIALIVYHCTHTIGICHECGGSYSLTLTFEYIDPSPGSPFCRTHFAHYVNTRQTYSNGFSGLQMHLSQLLSVLVGGSVIVDSLFIVASIFVGNLCPVLVLYCSA